jgi:hypothetical protein
MRPISATECENNCRCRHIVKILNVQRPPLHQLPSWLSSLDVLWRWRWGAVMHGLKWIVPFPGARERDIFTNNSPRNWLRLKTKLWNACFCPRTLFASSISHSIFYQIFYAKKTQTHFNPERGTAQLHKFVYEQERVHNFEAIKGFRILPKIVCYLTSMLCNMAP